MSQNQNLRTKRRLLLTAMVVMLSLSGCAGFQKYGAAKINSIPEGAEVVNLKDNSHLGTTPVHVSFSGKSGSSEYVTIQMRKPGYIDKITAFWINKRHDTALQADQNAVDINVTLEKRNNN